MDQTETISSRPHFDRLPAEMGRGYYLALNRRRTRRAERAALRARLVLASSI